ncbi:MAG: acetate--CoA ligase family protein, partial [Candidatus Micrarchaeia archaeon]
MDFLASMRLLEKYGLRFAPAKLAQNREEAVAAAREIGFPVVLKVVSPEIIHKTEKGCVLVNLQDAGHVASGYDIVVRNAGTARMEGVLVQKMVAEGVELIVGGKADPQFGPLLLFG